MGNLKDNVFKVDILTGADWDVGSFLTNALATLGLWGTTIVMIIGLLAMIKAIWDITTGLWSQGKKQTNWLLAFILLLVGGILAVPTGFEFVKGIAKGGKATIEDLGGGAIFLFEYSKFYFFK